MANNRHWLDTYEDDDEDQWSLKVKKKDKKEIKKARRYDWDDDYGYYEKR